MIYFKARYSNRYEPVIEEVDVQRENEFCVWIKGDRFDKISSYQRFFVTRVEAVGYLINRALEDLKRTQGEVDRIKLTLDKIKQL
jgi:hypothetical protein